MINVKEMAAAAVALVLASTTVEAETLHYYYVSGPVWLSNIEDPADRVLMNTGHLTVDRSMLGGDGSLANRTITRYFDEIYDPGADQSHAAVHFSFAQGGPDEFRLVFDENEQIVDWSFNTYAIGGVSWPFVNIHRGWGDSVVEGGVYHDEGRLIAEATLRDLGYREGTKAYDDLLCGSWAGVDDTNCREWGEVPAAWSAYHMAAAGTWHTSVHDFAAEVESVTRLAMANPPISRYDIAPVPLPAPLGLLVVGMGAIAFVRRRARG